jgi:hypothetical protein
LVIGAGAGGGTVVGRAVVTTGAGATVTAGGVDDGGVARAGPTVDDFVPACSDVSTHIVNSAST